MEEKNQTVQTLNSTAEKKEKPAINVEQLQGVLQQAEMRMRQMSEQMAQMNQMLRDKTIDQLFEVLKYFGISDIAYNQPKSLPYATENPWG